MPGRGSDFVSINPGKEIIGNEFALTGAIEQISTLNTLVYSVNIEAHPDNAAVLFIMNTAGSAKVHSLAAGASIEFPIDQPLRIQVQGTALDNLYWSAVVQ